MPIIDRSIKTSEALPDQLMALVTEKVGRVPRTYRPGAFVSLVADKSGVSAGVRHSGPIAVSIVAPSHFYIDDQLLAICQHIAELASYGYRGLCTRGTRACGAGN